MAKDHTMAQRCSEYGFSKNHFFDPHSSAWGFPSGGYRASILGEHTFDDIGLYSGCSSRDLDYYNSLMPVLDRPFLKCTLVSCLAAAK